MPETVHYGQVVEQHQRHLRDRQLAPQWVDAGSGGEQYAELRKNMIHIPATATAEAISRKTKSRMAAFERTVMSRASEARRGSSERPYGECLAQVAEPGHEFPQRFAAVHRAVGTSNASTDGTSLSGATVSLSRVTHWGETR